MERGSHSCSICFLPGPNLQKITETDKIGRSLIHKLQSCIPEIEWDDHYQICLSCSTDLDTAYTFREKCLSSDYLRDQKPILLESPVPECHFFDVVKEESTSPPPPDDPPPTKPQKLFICDLCDRKFKSSTDFVAHAVREHNRDAKTVKPFSCSVCPERFVTSANLGRHLQSHEGLSSAPPEIRQLAENTVATLLPDKSRPHYEKQFRRFEEWCTENKIQDLSESVLLAYFEVQCKKYKPTTLCTNFSMLKTCLNLYKDVDISKYDKLEAFLKQASEGYAPRKSQILEEEDINKFIREADDRAYLAMKIILIMGYSGACRRDELTNMSTDDVKYESDSIIVFIRKRKHNVPRVFTVADKEWIDLIKKYANLRPKKVTHKRFFLTYRNGYCTNSPIGINIMGKVSKDIAAFLRLPNPEDFTGHCFRRSSATHLANRRGDPLVIKRHVKMLAPRRNNLNLPGCSDDSNCDTSDTSSSFLQNVSSTQVIRLL